MPYTQESRIIGIETPLGGDVLLLQGFNGSEGISRLFRFQLDLLSEKPSISFNDIVGQRVDIKIVAHDGSERYFNGFVSRFAQSGSDQTFAHYQMEVVPWFWFLTRNANCRIFQNMSIPDIIQKIFSDRGFSDYKNSLTSSYSTREYCVQYRETDFNFVSRLMEQYGIYYFFEHQEGKHTLVLADSPSAHQKCPVQSSVRYAPSTDPDVDSVVTNWQIEQELRTGKYSLNDYNFETPSANLSASESTVVEVDSNTKYEIFDYPGIYGTPSDGSSLAEVRMQEEEAAHKIGRGSSTCRTLVSGYLFDLEEHDRDDFNAEYLITEVQHIGTAGASYGNGSGGSSYSNQFLCIASSTPFRFQRITAKPSVQGPQTAVVVGPSGEEIYVDKYGRVKVQFFWDREGKSDQNSSCWIRVSQAWAGAGWGAMWIPRIGQEVIVSFLEGDPDRPIITGRVYNANLNVPYALPDNHTRSTFQSRSSTGGTASNYNEIRFEDKAGSEQLFFNAEKDMDVNVENDSREKVGNNRSLIVTQNQMESIGGDLSVNITGNRNEKAGENVSLQVGQNLYEKVQMNYAHESSMNVYIKGGANVVIEAGVELTIKAGAGFVNIGPSGVAISGPMVLINSGGAAGAGNPPQPTDPVKPDEADNGSKGGKLS